MGLTLKELRIHLLQILSGCSTGNYKNNHVDLERKNIKMMVELMLVWYASFLAVPLMAFSGLYLQYEKFVEFQYSNKWKSFKLDNIPVSWTVIRQKGESQNGCYEKIKIVKFSEKRTFPSPWHAPLRVGKKCTFFGKFDVLCFLVTSVLKLARFEITDGVMKNWVCTARK